MASRKQSEDQPQDESQEQAQAPDYVDPAERTDPSQPMNKPRTGPTTGQEQSD